MAIERRISASELDFDQIKGNLVAYMKATDTTFNDYNYDGSAMATIIDVLSYITHVNSMNANFALNETFLDTAQLRSSVVSHAKLLGYTPRSISPSTAYINVRMNYDTTATPLFNHDGSNVALPLTMPRGTKFSTTIDGKKTTETYEGKQAEQKMKELEAEAKQAKNLLASVSKCIYFAYVAINRRNSSSSFFNLLQCFEFKCR